MSKSKYDQVAEGPAFKSNRYGLSDSEWAALSVEEREIHYNRQRVCEHPYVYDGPDPDDTSETSLRRAYSFDPYFHTAHMLPHSVELFFKGLCKCQTCLGKFGIVREGFRP
jgi:hypothetical protein